MGVSKVKDISVAGRVFAVGDMHGCVAEPSILLDYLINKEKLSEKDYVIFLGDYVDRGPDSKGAIQLMLDFQARFPHVSFLKGNHEDMLMDFLGYGGMLGEAYLYNGGLETLQSYGISVFASPREIITAFPEKHFKFMCELESIVVAGNFVFVHAGINPKRMLTKQVDNEIYWIREEFLDATHSLEKTIVFGHTPHREIFNHAPYKIGIDTGLVFGNKITCLEVTEGRLFQVARGTKEVVVSSANVPGFVR